MNSPQGVKSSGCLFCGLVQKKTNMLFENDKVFVMLSPQPAMPGHVVVLPKNHFPILELVPDFVVGEMFKAANKISISLFEAFGAHGTNMLVQNGPPAGQKHNHALINVLPRMENDGFDLSWNPKPSAEEDLERIASTINEATKSVGSFEREKPKPIEVEKPKEVQKEDPRLKFFKRIP